MNKTLTLVALLVFAAVTGCGGGGGTGSDTAGGNTNPNLQISDGSGIAGLAGSSCTTQYAPQGRVLDLDKAGYVVWYNMKVTCTLADGTKQAIAGLPASAFQFTGNDATNGVPEDMVTGTGSADRAPTYLVQLYRQFANKSVVTGNDEQVIVQGVDSLGRMVTAKGTVNPTAGTTQGVDDLTGGVSVAAVRTLDADGQGYTATTFLVAYAAQFGSTSPACPVSTGVKDFAAISVNQNGQTRDMRYCMYTALDNSKFYYTSGITSSASSWRWLYGPDANTQPASISVTSATLSAPSATGQRTPVYKITSAVRFPKIPNPNFVSVESGVTTSNPGWIYYDTPMPSTATLAGNQGGTWF